jgi:quinol monooxygenase YgiN
MHWLHRTHDSTPAKPDGIPGPNSIDKPVEDLVPYAVIAHYRCTAQDAGLIQEALLTMREHTLKEPGNLAYEVHAEPGAEPPAFILYEQYVDRAAFDAHAASDHFAKHILGTVRPRLTQRDVLFGEVLP